MSTEHQQYSTANQEERDSRIRRPPGIHDRADLRRRWEKRTQCRRTRTTANPERGVQNGQADFQAILVYDISRWGRFQDADESAYYEYLCKRAGIEVHYLRRTFENDGGPDFHDHQECQTGDAGEYSRELSSKVFKGQCRLIELGNRQGEWRVSDCVEC